MATNPPVVSLNGSASHIDGRWGSGTPAILAQGLGKMYGTHVAVNNLNLAVRPGEILGFLGPNGAGKTTTIKMLTGLLKPTAGTAAILGHDIQRDAGGGQSPVRLCARHAQPLRQAQRLGVLALHGPALPRAARSRPNTAPANYCACST